MRGAWPSGGRFGTFIGYLPPTERLLGNRWKGEAKPSCLFFSITAGPHVNGRKAEIFQVRRRIFVSCRLSPVRGRDICRPLWSVASLQWSFVPSRSCRPRSKRVGRGTPCAPPAGNGYNRRARSECVREFREGTRIRKPFANIREIRG